ncbi:MAG: OmpH family outer membrane protein [bacterium]|nr:OmpH family outer membrane protein [bacterium]
MKETIANPLTVKVCYPEENPALAGLRGGDMRVRELSRIKIQSFITVLFCLFVFGDNAYSASGGAEIKMGYIDSNRLLNEYKGKDELKVKLQKQLEKWEKDAIAQKEKIQKLIKEFESQGAMLSDDAKARKQKDIEQKQIEYETFVQKIWGAEGEAKKINEEVMKPVVDKVNVILQRIGKEREYTIIFDVASTGVVYAKEGMDLTNEVVDEINKEFAPVGAAKADTGRTYFCVLRLKENSEASKYTDSNTMVRLIKAGLERDIKYKMVESNVFNSALTQVNIGGKKEEDLTPEEAAKVGEYANANIVIIGSVERIGESVTLRCRVVNVSDSQILADASETSRTSETTDLNNMTNKIITKILEKLKK